MQLTVSRGAGKPLYQQLKEAIASAIRRGDPEFTCALPSEKTLSQAGGVNRHTLRNALRALEAEHLIRSEPGRGWFVSPHARQTATVGFINCGDPDYRPDYPTVFSRRVKEGRDRGCAANLLTPVRISLAELQQIIDGAPGPDVLIWESIAPRFIGYLKLLRQRGVKLVISNRPLFGEGFPCICIEQYYSSRELVSQLVAAGHRKIGCITVDLPFRYLAERTQGYSDALAANGIDVSNKLICKLDLNADNQRRLKSFFLRNRGMTGLFISAESLHACTFRVLEKLKLTIPGDISVVAFDRVICGVPDVTAMDQPLEALGEESLNMARALLDGKTPEMKILQPHLIPGKSIRELPGGAAAPLPKLTEL